MGTVTAQDVGVRTHIVDKSLNQVFERESTTVDTASMGGDSSPGCMGMCWISNGSVHLI